MKWGKWSTTASSNSATPPDGWPEGQLPSTVNDCAREMMAQIKAGISDVQFIDLDMSPIQTSNTTFTVTGNQMAFLEYGRRVKCQVGASTLYGTVYSSTFTTNTGVSLRLDSGLLTGSLSAIAVGFPSGTNGALGNGANTLPTPIINGQFDIWQRANSFSYIAATAIYTADRWLFQCSLSAGAGIINRYERSANASNVPSLAQTGVLLTNAIGVSVSAALASVATGNYMSLVHRIEGYNWRQIAHKPNTISFWARSTKTGTYCVALQSSNADRSMVLEYSISSTDTWERKTLTFGKAPTTGTWDYSSGIGLNVNFTLVAGATLQGGQGNWTAASIIATSNQTNFNSSAGNIFMLAGVKIEEGVVATPLQYVEYGAELARCQRYYTEYGQANHTNFIGWAQNGATGLFWIEHRPELRAAAGTVTFPAVTQMVVTGSTGGSTASAVAVTNNGTKATLFTIATAAGFGATADAVILFLGVGGTAIKVSAEL